MTSFIKSIFYVVWLFPLFCITARDSSLPEPYNQVELLPFDPHGYYGNSDKIEKLFGAFKIETAIEIGSWLGTSTRHIASLLPSNGKIYAVDHFLGSTEHQPGEREYNSALPRLYQQFLSNVIHAKLTDKIIPVKMSSVEAAHHLCQVMPDLIYLDASHEKEPVLIDLHAWYPYVKGRGILCGDDWRWPEVAAAVRIFAKEQKLTIYSHDNFWSLAEDRHRAFYAEDSFWYLEK